mgnify:CR=1 FL=1
MKLAGSQFLVSAGQHTGAGLEGAGKMALIEEAAFVSDAGERPAGLPHEAQGLVYFYPAHIFAQRTGKVAWKVFGDGDRVHV